MTAASRHKLLVIDDSNLIRMAVSILLEKSGYEVKIAENITEFDDLLTEWWPDTILTDVQMPEISGDELCRTIKKRLLVRVVLFSNLPPTRLAELAERSGADGFISKLEGFDALPEKLAAIIKSTAHEDETSSFGVDSTSSKVSPTSSARAQASPSEPERVILLDDTVPGSEIAGTVLAREGFDVRIASNLSQFSQVFDNWQPNAVLVVPHLAGVDEGKVGQLVRARMGATSVPVVLFSELSDEQLSPLVKLHGADHGLSKLDGFERLFSKLHKICRGDASSG